MRATRFGVGMALGDYVKAANAETLVIAQIETVAAVEALPEMLKVPGVDVFFIGTPNELAQSLGYPARQDEPAVLEVAIRKAPLPRSLKAGKDGGIHGARRRGGAPLPRTRRSVHQHQEPAA